MPSGIGAQAPSVPPVFTAVHASHVPSQAVSQQTLSTQKLLVHSEPVVHGVPLAPAGVVLVVVSVVVVVVVVLVVGG